MLTLRCFGSAAVYDDTTAENLPLRSRKHLGLLLYLACHPKTLHTREELAALLWDDTGSRERHSLSQALYDIRSKLGTVLEADTTTVQFRPDRLRCEAQQFEDAVERGDHETALELFRGEFAPNLIHLGSDTFDRWLDGERERHRVLAILALRNAQKTAEERGDWDRSCLAALRLIRLNDFDEKSHRALMRGLWMKGDAASALAHYDALKARQPGKGEESLSSETRELAHLIATGDATVGMGTGGPALVGRQRELQAIVRALDDVLRGNSLSLLLVGAQGYGKTHLLTSFAKQARSRGAEVCWGPPKPERHGAARRRKRAAIVILDDADNLTHTELTSLSSALRPADQKKLLLIAAVRLPRAALHHWLSRLYTTRPRVVELGPLPTPAMNEILSHSDVCRSDRRGWIRKLAGGNPLYALELARCIDDRHPASLLRSAKAANLRAVLSAALVGLKSSERRILEYIAALGPEPVAEGLLVTLDPEARASNRLPMLAARGMIVAQDSGWQIHPPILREYLSFSLSVLRRTAINLKAALILKEDASADSCAVARYYERSSFTREAHDWALRAARKAIHERNVEIASQASDLALRTASVVGERLEASLVRALARLEQGQNLLAWHDLKALSATGVMSETDTTELHIALSSAAYALGRQRDAEEELGRVWRDRKGTPRALSRSQRIRAATIALHLARSANDERRLRHDLNSVDEALGNWASDSIAEQRWWLEALLARMAITLTNESLTSARAILSKHAHSLQHLSKVFLPTLLALKAVVSAKEGCLDEAAALLSDANINIGEQEGTILQASILNNWAAVLLEQGRFGGATRLLEEGTQLDARLGLQGVFATHPYLNLGACALYSGQVEVADRHFTTAEKLSGNGAAGLTAQVIASRGIVALHRRDPAMVERCFTSLRNIPASCGWGEERFAVAWFRGWYLASQRPAEGKELLLAAAEAESARDVVSAEKLRFLAHLASRCRKEGAKDCARHSRSAYGLARIGVGWFPRSAAVLWKGF